jgi:hypothetical protein
MTAVSNEYQAVIKSVSHEYLRGRRIGVVEVSTKGTRGVIWVWARKEAQSLGLEWALTESVCDVKLGERDEVPGVGAGWEREERVCGILCEGVA